MLDERLELRPPHRWQIDKSAALQQRRLDDYAQPSGLAGFETGDHGDKGRRIDKRCPLPILDAQCAGGEPSLKRPHSTSRRITASREPAGTRVTVSRATRSRVEA